MAVKTEPDRLQALEALLNDARNEADALQRQVQDLRNVVTSTRLIMGHELKKPTTAITGYIDLAQEDVDKASELADTLRKARSECELLNELNLFFLQLLKLDHKDNRVHERCTNVGRLVKEVIGHLPKALKASARIKLTLEEAVNFRVNENALKIVLSNLVENALNYSDNKVALNIERSRDKRGMADRDLLKIRVCDKGRGIPKQYLKNIFNPFVRVPESGPSEGSGLGLTLVRSLVELCGGQV